MSDETRVRVSPMLRLLSAHFEIIAQLEWEIDHLESELNCMTEEIKTVRSENEDLEIENERLRSALGETMEVESDEFVGEMEDCPCRVRSAAA